MAPLHVINVRIGTSVQLIHPQSFGILSIVAFVDDFTVDGRSEGAWKIENTAGRFSTSIPHHSFLRG